MVLRWLLAALCALGGGCLLTPSHTDPEMSCDPIVNTSDSGHHNPGSDCMQCHDGTMPDAPRASVGGTVYATGSMPLPGASIRVRDAHGQSMRLISALNGNFYSASPMAYPITVIASACPHTVPMLGLVLPPGDCNACHLTDGDPGRIRLP